MMKKIKALLFGLFLVFSVNTTATESFPEVSIEPLNKTDYFVNDTVSLIINTKNADRVTIDSIDSFGNVRVIQDKKNLNLAGDQHIFEWIIPYGIVHKSLQKRTLQLEVSAIKTGTGRKEILSEHFTVTYRPGDEFVDFSHHPEIGKTTFSPLSKKEYNIGDTVSATIHLENIKGLTTSYSFRDGHKDWIDSNVELKANQTTHTVELKIPEEFKQLLGGTNPKYPNHAVRLSATGYINSEKGGQTRSYSEPFKIIIPTEPETEYTPPTSYTPPSQQPVQVTHNPRKNVCMNSVVERNGKYTIKLLGIDGKRSADCRFTGYEYDVLSGDAELIGMNEYELIFDSQKKGTIKIKTTYPSYYEATFIIHGNNTSSQHIYHEEPLEIQHRGDFINSAQTGQIRPIPNVGLGEVRYRGEKNGNWYTSEDGVIWKTIGTGIWHDQNAKYSDLDRFEFHSPETPGTYYVTIQAFFRGKKYTQTYDFHVSCYPHQAERNGKCEDVQKLTPNNYIPVTASHKYNYYQNDTPSKHENRRDYLAKRSQTETTFKQHPNTRKKPSIVNALYHYKDLPNNSLEKEAVVSLSKKGVIQGYQDKTFRPNQELNRAELAKMLLTAKGHDILSTNKKGRFKDVRKTEWYANYIETAAEHNIIQGYSDGTFRPGEKVNTAEFLTMLGRTFKHKQINNLNYSDVPNNEWFAPYTSMAKEFNLMPSRGKNTIQPSQNVTRGEVAIAIYRYLQTTNK